MKDLHIMLVVWFSHLLGSTNGVNVTFDSGYNTNTPPWSEATTEQIPVSWIENQHNVSNNGNGSDHISQFESTLPPERLSLSKIGSAKLEELLDELSSCRQKCGQIQQFPCSCDLKCLIHKNCCEDMSTVCPKVLDESRIRYSHMLGMKVECSLEGIFIITDCENKHPTALPIPDISHTMTDATSTPTTTYVNVKSLSDSATTIASQLQDGQNSVDINYILEFINNAYVTDTATGFVYKNFDIFSCAAQDNSHPVTWNVRFPTTFLTNPRDIDFVLSIILTNAKPIYSQPPWLMDNLTAAACQQRSIGTCQEKWIQDNQSLLDKCQEFISYVTVKNLQSQSLFDNRYCALCNIGQTAMLETVTSLTAETLSDRNSFSFSLIMTLSGDSIKIISDSTDKSLSPMPWMEATCDLSEPNSTFSRRHNGLCAIRSCKDNFVRRPDGVCKQLCHLTLAVSDDGYAPLTADEYEVFPVFVQCFMKSLGIDSDGDFTPTMMLFDRRLNITLYATQTNAYDENLWINGQLSEVTMDVVFSRLSMMSKSLKDYRSSKINFLSRLTYQSSFSKQQEIYSRIAQQEYRDVKSYLHRGNVTEQKNVTNVCYFAVRGGIQRKEIPGNSSLFCLQDPMYEEDEEMMSAYLNSSCFSIFDKKQNGGESTFKSSTSIIYLVFTVFSFVAI